MIALSIERERGKKKMTIFIKIRLPLAISVNKDGAIHLKAD